MNADTQYHWGGRGVLVDYDAVRSASATFGGTSQASGPLSEDRGWPGAWRLNQLAAIIDETLAGEDHILVEFKPGTAAR